MFPLSSTGIIGCLFSADIPSNQSFRLRYGFSRNASLNSFIRSILLFTCFDLAIGKTKCKSGCTSLLVFKQEGHSPQESFPFLLLQNKYWANATAVARFPLPSYPVNKSA